MGCCFMPKGVPKYDGAFKKQIVEEMREKGLSYREIARQYEIRGAHSVADWERLYFEEGPDGLFIERRGRGSKGWSPKKLKPEVEENLLAEVQRLRAENAYLKESLDHQPPCIWRCQRIAVSGACQTNERACQLVLKLCHIGALAADASLSRAAGAERRLLTLKTKHPVIHCHLSPSAF